MPLISIIVPIYNVEEYLGKCVNSLLGQTIRDIEIILVNDGSTDSCAQICDAYASKDSRIKVIHKKNGGLSDARNSGIKIAKGKYIAFLDSDDWVELNCYEYLYNLIEEQNADIVQCDYVKVYKSEDKIVFNKEVKFAEYTGEEALNLLYGEQYPKTIVVWNKLYKKKIFDKIIFPKGFVHEDEFVTYKALHQAGKVIDSNLPLVGYRQREGSIMNKEFNVKRLDVLQAYIERREYFYNEGLIELVKKTDANICSILKNLYIKTYNSSIDNREEIIAKLKENIKRRYVQFLFNNHITLLNKVAITICLMNEKLFFELCMKYIKRQIGENNV